jgi:hypothetical protein
MTDGPTDADPEERFDEDLQRALAEGPMAWPEDDTVPPEDLPGRGIGLPPPGGGAIADGGWEHSGRNEGADTETDDRDDEDADNER